MCFTPERNRSRKKCVRTGVTGPRFSSLLCCVMLGQLGLFRIKKIRIREYTLSFNLVTKPTVRCDSTFGGALLMMEHHLFLHLTDSLLLLTSCCVFSGIQPHPPPTPQQPAPSVQIRCSVNIWWSSKWAVLYYRPPWWWGTIGPSIRSIYECKTMEISRSHSPAVNIWVSRNRPLHPYLKIGQAHMRSSGLPSVSSWRSQIIVSISSFPNPRGISGRN